MKQYVGKLKKNKSPLVLTVNGRAKLVVQDASSYQEMLDRLERAETIAGEVEKHSGGKPNSVPRLG